MSSSGIDPTNSGPLVIRTYNNIMSEYHTMVLRDYDLPVSSNRLLATVTGGCLVPTDAPSVSSLTVRSTLYGSQSVLSTCTLSSLQASSIVTSTLTSSGSISTSSLVSHGPTVWRGSVLNITTGSTYTLDAEYWGKYIFVNSDENVQMTLPSGQDGVFMTIQQYAPNLSTTVTNVFGGMRTISTQSTLTVMYNTGLSRWLSLTNN